MAFPEDLNDVIVFKIHPAIGMARLSKNEDYYIFGEDPGNYKSNGLIKRQAVQFRIFAYGENHVGLGELTPEMIEEHGITATWSAQVANRKIARLENTPLTGSDFVISAKASSDDENEGQLTGSIENFEEGDVIPMGQITADGIFIPPLSNVFRKKANEPVVNFPARSKSVADNTSDGSINVSLEKDGESIEVMPACIVVAPQDFSPDTEESYNLYNYLRDMLPQTNSNSGTVHNQTAKQIDEMAIRSGTADFAPGMELSLGRRGEVMDVNDLFYQQGIDENADSREIRVRYRDSAGESGAVHGQLTSGLCSTWQGDFTACVGYWSEHLPRQAFLDENDTRSVMFFRKNYADTMGPTLESGDDFEQSVDKMGIARVRRGRKVETERDPGDDV
ncbi:MAG TPA: hypothetical protein EYG68_12620 [Leucothrix mucor]|nr:hypothetical protein [Leucothrix mucor]